MRTGSLTISIDIEDWYHIPSVSGSPFSTYSDVNEFFQSWNGRYDYLTQPTRKILKILEEFNITATFFIVADVVEHYPNLVESIVDKGHEIACHGLHHSCKIDPITKKPLMSRSEFESWTLKARKILENVSKEKVIGYRAPNGLIGYWMLEVLNTIGFLYDSSVSVNSLYNKTDMDLHGVSSVPYLPLLQEGQKDGAKHFVEFPWAFYDIGIKLPTSGGPMLRFLGKGLILRGLLQSLERGHTVMYFHPIDISTESFPAIGNKRPMYWIFKGKLVERRLYFLLKSLKGVKKMSYREYIENSA